MTSQPPLYDGVGSSLAGPQFTPRPGWGGRLGRWFSHHAYIIVFRLVMVVALVLISHSLFSDRTSNGPRASATVTPLASSPRPISLQAHAGEGMTILAARALDLYVALAQAEVHLDGAQHLFAVDALARTAGWRPLEVNQEVSFLPLDIASAVDRAQKLTPGQRAAWERLAR